MKAQNARKVWIVQIDSFFGFFKFFGVVLVSFKLIIFSSGFYRKK